MRATIHQEVVLDDPVEHFVTGELGYFAYTRSGLSLAIVRAHPYQPPIVNLDDYATYLWLECAQGFFLLRQRILEAAPEEWSVVRQLVPEAAYGFFQDFLEDIGEYVTGVSWTEEAGDLSGTLNHGAPSDPSEAAEGRG